MEETKKTTESEDDTEETGKRKEESEEQPESPSELAVGAGGTSPPTPKNQEDDDDDREAARNEKGEEQLSVVKVVTKKTFIQTPITVEEPVKKINFENKTPEPEEGEPRIESTSGVRLAVATPQQAVEGTNSADEEKQEEDLNYTFGKQEPIGWAIVRSSFVGLIY